jgi:AcrR family transcriptional regulator
MDTATHSIASQRALDILDKVKSVFAFNGFDGASMQDLAQATQMSVGNFYRYFPSKNAIITALVERDLKEIEAVFQTVRAASEPGPVVHDNCCVSGLKRCRMRMRRCGAEVQAASFRTEEIGDAYAQHGRNGA